MKFSLIVPTYQRPLRLERCLRAIQALRFPASELEVIVVDDGSETPPTSLVENSSVKFAARLLVQAHAGPAAARNAGAAVARGQYLAFTDDDCAVHPDWLTILETQLAHTPDRAAGGRTENLLPDLYATASQDLVSYLYTYFQSKRSDRQFFTSNNMVVPADGFRAVGGFNSQFTFAAAEDRDFFGRWLAAGRQTVYVPEAVVYHAHEMTLREFCRQHFNYGRGAYRYHRLRARRARDHIRFEPLSFYLNLVLYPMRQHRPWATKVGVAFMLFLSQLANAAGFVAQRWHTRT